MSSGNPLVDFRGCEISGATPTAIEAFERALAAFQAWRMGAEHHLALALHEAPAFAMAKVLDAHMCLASRDPARVRSARIALERACRLVVTARERAHVAAIAAVLADDYEQAKAVFGVILRHEPRDVLALQMAHAFDYLTGDVARLGDRVALVLPAWSSHTPGYHSVLSMHAFGLEEVGEFGRAESVARQALALDPSDARAHHVLAHVFEMTNRADAGTQWMHDHMHYWATDTVVATHCWWHLALFHLAQGQIERALSIYDTRVRANQLREVADMIDAAALLWRIALRGVDVGPRWNEISIAWAPHICDAFCTFNDLHAMIAFVGARKWNLARKLVRELAQRHMQGTRYGETTRLVGLPACRAVLAFGRGKFTRAIELLVGLPMLAHRIGGSHAQRDLLHLTLRRAVEYTGGPAFRLGAAAFPPRQIASTSPRRSILGPGRLVTG